MKRTAPYTIVDLCAAGYNGAVLLFVLLARERIPAWSAQAALSLSMVAGSLLLPVFIRGSAPGFLRAIRNLYPLVFLLFQYEQTGSINRVFFAEFLDPLFMRLEEAIFRCHPAVKLAEWLPWPWFNEYMHFAYFTYYLQFIGMALFLYLRRGHRAFMDFMFAFSATFYVCYAIYIVWPVRGGAYYGLGHFPTIGPFTAIMNAIYSGFEIEGAAFPSSHCAIAFLVLWYACLYARRSLWWLAPLVVSLWLSTVYCRYHYAVDVLAGLATTAVLVPIWRRINPERRPQRSGAIP